METLKLATRQKKNKSKNRTCVFTTLYLCVYRNLLKSLHLVQGFSLRIKKTIQSNFTPCSSTCVHPMLKKKKKKRDHLWNQISHKCSAAALTSKKRNTPEKKIRCREAQVPMTSPRRPALKGFGHPLTSPGSCKSGTLVWIHCGSNFSK